MRLQNPDGITINEKTITVDKNGHAPYINFDEEDANIIVLAYQPGVGKTHNAIEYMKKKKNANSFYFTNRHEAIKERIKKWKSTNTPLPTHWYGFEQSCQNKNKIKYFNYGIPPKQLCSNCNQCNYLALFKAQQRVFAPIDYLPYHKFTKKIQHLKTIFIDERISNVGTCTIEINKTIKALETIGTKNNYIQNIKERNWHFFTLDILERITKRHWNFIIKAYNNRDTDSLEKVKYFKPSTLKNYIDWGRKYNFDRLSYGIPFYYNALDLINSNPRLKLVISDASFSKNLFKYFLESYNGEIGLNNELIVNIYNTENSNKNTVIYRMRPNYWHPKANFTTHAETTSEWLYEHIKKIREIFGDKKLGIISFKENIDRWRLLGIKDIESYGALRGTNKFEDKDVLVVLGHFFPPLKKRDKEKIDDEPINEDKKDIIDLIEDWFLLDKNEYSLIEVNEFIQKLSKSKKQEKRKLELYLGAKRPKRYADEPYEYATSRRPAKPVRLVQNHFDDEVYQAVHRNRGLQHNRIIFIYCWIPPYRLRFSSSMDFEELDGKDGGKKIIDLAFKKWNFDVADVAVFFGGEKLYRLWDEFKIEVIEEDEENGFFETLREKYGDIGLIHEIIEDIELGKAPSALAQYYRIHKGSGEGTDTETMNKIIKKYYEFKRLLQEKKAKRRE